MLLPLNDWRSYIHESHHSCSTLYVSYFFSQMFFNVFLSVLIHHPDSIPVTAEFRQCFYYFFIRNTRNQINIRLSGLQRSYTRTLRYFRALRVVDRVVEAVLQLRLSSECRKSLLQMTHCAHCAGLPGNSQTCSGLCLNTLRGCLMDLGDLVEPIRDFSRALNAMKNEVTQFNFYNQVTFVSSYIFTLIRDTTSNFRNILTEVSSKNDC